MKKILFILAIGLIASCTKLDTDGTTKSGNLEFDVVNIDSCQYLISHLEETVLFTHKGDCNNSIHEPIIMYADTNIGNQLDSLK